MIDVPKRDDVELRFEAIAKSKSSADVVCRLGEEIVHRDQLNLSKATERKRFTRDLIGVLGEACPIEVDAIASELMSLADSLNKPSKNGQALPVFDPTSNDELDASQVIRPELICQADVSAIAVPRMRQVGGNVHGDWLHLIRRGSKRCCEPLVGQLKLPNGIPLWLSPVPGAPTPGDVREMNRWSKARRKQWLNGKASPTTAETLRMVAERINRYVVLPPNDDNGHGLTLAAWVMMTYVYPALPAVPYLYLSGPPNSGKTRSMDVLSRMVFRPMMTSNTGAPVIFRTRHAFGGVLLFDEAERMRDARSPDVAEILSILLAGYRKGGRASRMEPSGESYKAVSFDCFGPVVLGCIKGLPPALASRCITVRMMRAAKGQPQVSRSLEDSTEQASKVLDALHCWAIDYGHAAISEPSPSTHLANRDAELWGPLLRIVAHAGDAQTLKLMIDHAQRMAKSAADDSSPEFDAILLMAYYQLRKAGQTPQAGEILEQAKKIDSEPFDDSWKPRMVGGILRRYFESKKSNGRKVYRDSQKAILDVAERYGYEIGEASNE